MLPTKNFSGVPIVASSRDRVSAQVIQTALDGPATTFRLVNAGTFDAASRVETYSDLLRGEGFNLPDGRPLTEVIRRTAPADVAVDQVRGPWLFEDILARGRTVALRHFLLGSSDETLGALMREIESKFPGTLVVGSHSPPYRLRTDHELAAADAEVMASGAHIVWVALGTPKQDAEAIRILRATGLTTVAVGAAFDFTAGTTKPAPAIVQRLGLEWLFRLATEPRRLWRRYLIGNTRFLVMTLKHFRER